MDRRTVPNDNAMYSLTEKQLQLKMICRNCWMEALNITDLHQHDANFLMLGGNSLAAMLLISKIRRLGKVDVQIIDLLMNPCYREFLEVVLKAPNIKDTALENKTNTCLSLAQKRMLVLHAYAPTSTSYVESFAIATMKTSNTRVVEAFETLLTIQPELKTEINMNQRTGEYERKINPHFKIDVNFENVKEGDDLSDFITKSIPAVEVLSSPLVKFRCIQRQNSTIIAVHIHHIIEDEVTLGRTVNNLIKILNNEDICSTTVSYSEYVTSEEQYITSAAYEADELFWREKYQSLPPSTTLSVMPLSEATWKDIVAYKTKHQYIKFGTENTKLISQTIDDLQITEFVYYLACTSLAVHRYIGVDDFVIAIPVSVRDDVHQTTDGLFLNTLLFRISINPESTFREHILKVKTEWLLAQNSRRYPFDRLAHWMLTTQKQSIHSICSIILNYNMRILKEEEIMVYSKHAKMPLILNLYVKNRNDETGLRLEWAEELLDGDIVKRMGDSITSLCSACIPFDDRIIDFEVLPPSELSLIHSFSTQGSHQTALSTEDEMQIQFEQHTKRFPENTAIVFEQESVTYAELNRMASCIAQCISSQVSLDALKSNPVILFSKKDICAVALMIGIWKIRGFFLPIAVSISKRKSLNDLSTRITPAAVIYNCSEQDFVMVQEAKFTCPVINVETALKHTSECYLWSQKSKPQLNKIAYTQRTSGTTGIPKVFTISHHNLNVISNAWKLTLNMMEKQVNVFQWVLLSFGVFINDVVRALICVPGKLIMCPDDKRLDVLYIRDKINKEKITLMEVTPHFASVLIENANKRDFCSLSVIILSSDVAHTNVFRNVKNFLRPDQRVINGYGMTEATNDSVYFEGNFIPSTRSGTIPIGKPLPGVFVYVCDPKTLLPCPVGTVGELYISGDVIACGDVNVIMLGNGRRAALKTGDLCCWLPCGNLEFLGRLDNILKIRGFRISTAEIEEQITKYTSGVKESCVTVLTDNSTNKRQYLCAYIVADPLLCPSPSAIRRILAHELPNYMIPDIIHFCEQLPKTVYGKIDKKGLPFLLQNQDFQQCDKIDASIQEDSNTVLVLKKIFAQAMEVEDTIFKNNHLTFRENGASSLTLVRFFEMIKSKTSFQLEIADLFSYPSFSCLADYIDEVKQLYSAPIDNIGHNADKSDEIAITGIGIRLPSGIDSLSKLWKVLEKGQDVVRSFPDNRFKDVKGCSSSPFTGEIYHGAFLDSVDLFDNDFFRISKEEAKFMSPEQRLFLQVATEALIEARNVSEVNGSNIGVYLSTIETGYSKLDYPNDIKCLAGLVPGMVATRVAYQWNLKGPYMLVDSACSSSLMALKLASESITRNECEGALVGGVNLYIYPDNLINYGEAEIHSPDFCCRAFDENANGTVLGEGVLCLYIEKLSTAVEKGKHIYGIVKGVASASVGRGNGITAPSALSQETAIKAALKTANVDKRDVNYIETHGSGTKLGDSIEISALSSVFNDAFEKTLPIGTSKSMFGSLDTASGLLGVIKVLASIMFNKIPPSANFKNPIQKLKDACLSVVKNVENWKFDECHRKIAGVHSFGLTGLSCHTIISDCISSTTLNQDIESKTPYPLFFRGKNFNHIKRQVHSHLCLIRETIQKRNLNTLIGVCFVVAQKLRDLAGTGHGHSEFRMVITVKTTEQILEVLSLIQTLRSTDDLASISCMRDDIHILFPGVNNASVVSNHVIPFLYEDKIDIFESFGEDVKNIIPAFGVNLSLYAESRHWLDSNDKSGLQHEDCQDIQINTRKQRTTGILFDSMDNNKQ